MPSFLSSLGTFRDLAFPPSCILLVSPHPPPDFTLVSLSLQAEICETDSLSAITNGISSLSRGGNSERINGARAGFSNSSLLQLLHVRVGCILYSRTTRSLSYSPRSFSLSCFHVSSSFPSQLHFLTPSFLQGQEFSSLPPSFSLYIFHGDTTLSLLIDTRYLDSITCRLYRYFTDCEIRSHSFPRVTC